MFINKLGLKNFKCFKEVEVSFAKITLLTGANSSGKSSLIYGLLAPFQSDRFPLYLFPNGKYVDMGDFAEISFKNDTQNKIEINIDFNYDHNNINISTQWILDPTNHLPKLYYLKTERRYDFNEVMEISFSENNYICNFKDKITDIKDLKISGLDKFVYTRYSEDKNKFTEDMKSTNTILDRIDNIMPDLEIYPSLNFIGSYRLYPERTYYQKPKSIDQILTSGEGFIDQILEWQEQGDGTFDELLCILRELNLLYDIKPDKIGGGRFDLRIQVKENSNWASLADIGFGVSQLLPIIVADLQLWDNSTLIMAQPEIHLHPSIQAELGSYLVKQVDEGDKQYIIETHSEYLINRLRLCIVKGEIQPDDVAVYYFENTAEEGSITHKIEFTKHGEILNAPRGFFDTYMIDTMDIALNA